MDKRLDMPWFALRYGIGATAALAGIDKFFNILADWGSYVSPVAARVLPVSTGTFMGAVGIIELAVGAAILLGWVRLGGYVASAWLLCIAANLVAAGFFDVAVRDVIMSVAAFTLARMADVRGEAPAYGVNSIARSSHSRATA